MNPREKLSEADNETARAFVQLFAQFGDKFHFPVDSNTESEKEVRAHLIESDNEFEGMSTISVTCINEEKTFKELWNCMEGMGLEILETEAEEREDEDLGLYTSQVLTARPMQPTEEEWNVPHLVIYGSLTPEIEEACYAAFGHQYEFENIRNHYVVYGEGLEEKEKTNLATAIQNSPEFFEDMKRDYVSHVRTAEYV